MGLDVNHLLRGGVPDGADGEFPRQGDPAPAFRGQSRRYRYSHGRAWAGESRPASAPCSRSISSRNDGAVWSLKNVNLQGDDLSVRGELTLDDKRQPVAFSFPVLSLNHADAAGNERRVDRNNVWQVRGRARSYDGRQFFRSLFSAGKIAEDQPGLPKDTPGVDIKLDVDNVLGFFDTTVKNVSLEARRRNDKLVYLDLHGRLNGKEPGRGPSRDQDGRSRAPPRRGDRCAARPSVWSASIRRRAAGRVSLKVNLDGSGPAEKIGVLYARNFVIVGDQVVGEVLSGPKIEQTRGQTAARPRRNIADQLEFDRLRVPVLGGLRASSSLHDAIINGPLLGATMRGNIDFRARAHQPVGHLCAALRPQRRHRRRADHRRPAVRPQWRGHVRHHLRGAGPNLEARRAGQSDVAGRAGLPAPALRVRPDRAAYHPADQRNEKRSEGRPNSVPR